MPHTGVNGKQKNRFHWKTIAVITPLIISLVLIGDIIFCTISPSNYSSYDLDYRLPLRTLVKPTPAIDLFRTTVILTDAPISTKMTCTIHVNSPSKAEYNIKDEYRLTRNAIVDLKVIPVMEYEKFNEYSASLDGNSLTLNIVEVNGTKYYGMSDFNLTNTNEVRTIVVSYTAEYYPVSGGAVKIPWVFTDKYTQTSGFWLPTIPVEKGSTSDVCKLQIDYSMPYTKVLIEQSGWLDSFANAKSGWTYYGQNQTINAQSFEYPIEQNVTKDGNSYIFLTVFSEQNQSNQPTLTVVPDFFGAPLLMVSFLASPFLIIIAESLDEKRSKESSKGQSNTKSLLSLLYKTFKSYALPLAVASFIGISTYPNAIILLTLIYEITNPIVLSIVILFPAIFYIIYAFVKKSL
jgi:hypothetical protein